MAIYFLLLFVVTVFIFVAEKTRSQKLISYFFIFSTFLSLVFIAGLRSNNVGTDTGSYAFFFERKINVAVGVFDIGGGLEPGYQILENLVMNVSPTFVTMLFSVAIIVVFVYIKAIYKFSYSPTISLFVLVTLGYYTFFFNGARQGIAAAIYCLSFEGLIQGKFKQYAFWVFIAFLFHKTALFALPFYFVFRQKFSFKFLILILFFGGISVLFFDSILNLGALLSEKYSMYKGNKAVGAKLLTVFYVSISLFFILFRKYISDRDKNTYDIFLNMLILGASIYFIVTITGAYVELNRVAFYFQVGIIFLWPLVFKNLSSEKSLVFSFPFFIGHLIFFYIFIGKMAALVPYELNPQFLSF